jgi:hypothetical protein
MSFLGLDPDSLAARTRAAIAPVPTLAQSLLRGALGFTILSVAGFVPWAVLGGVLHKKVGEAGMYAACALVFIALSGPLLHRLIMGPGSLIRFYALFSVAFTLYSIGWIAGWMVLRGHTGSLVGLLAGTALMGLVFCLAFRAMESLPVVVAVLFLANSAGYFLGGVVEGLVYPHLPTLAMLLWGVFYGLGLGAGLGLAFFTCQKKARALLAQNAP